MIKHIFKIMWNRRRSNSLLIIEIFFSFIVLFALCSFAIYCVKSLFVPLGFSYDSVFTVKITSFGSDGDNPLKQKVISKQIIQDLKNLKEVAEVSRSISTIPYGESTSSISFDHRGREILAHVGRIDKDFEKVWSIELRKGKWFDPENSISKYIPIVINRALANDVFGGDNPVHQILDNKYKVFGVIEDFRYKGEFFRSFPFFFLPIDEQKKDLVANMLVIKTKPLHSGDFTIKIKKVIHDHTKNWVVKIRKSEDMRTSYIDRYRSLIIAMSIIVGFLLINVALGLIGVLWNNVNKRFSEIGLRKAIGATGSMVSWQIIGESLAMTTFGIVLAYLLVYQLPMFNFLSIDADIYFYAIAVSTISMYGLVLGCALYPSWMASTIKPATALHFD